MFQVLAFATDDDEEMPETMYETMYESSQTNTGKRTATGKEIILYTGGLYTKFHCN